MSGLPGPQRLQATQFIRSIRSGRTEPWLVAAEAEEGCEQEVVVKLRGSPQIAPHGLAAELVAALLARDLGIPVQPPLVVLFDVAFVQALPNADLRRIGLDSIGANFGTRKWPPGFTIWTRGLPVSQDQQRTLAEILAFDCMIQNPDRTASNPNCVVRGDRVIAFDHDLAFSNLLAVSGHAPSEFDSLGFLGEHVFRSAVAGHSFDAERLRAAVRTVSGRRIADYLRCVPKSWTPDPGVRDRMARHLRACTKGFDMISQNLGALL